MRMHNALLMVLLAAVAPAAYAQEPSAGPAEASQDAAQVEPSRPAQTPEAPAQEAADSAAEETPQAATLAVEEELEPPAPPPKAVSLDELLELVRQGFSQEREENRQREQRFLQMKAQQQKLLDDALATFRREEVRSQQLETAFAENEATLAELEEELDKRLGTLGELFGVVRQVAGDMQGHAWESLTSSQLGNREAILERLGRSTELPSTEDLEKLWYELHREMTEQGKVVRYQTPVLTADGNEERREVIRAGVFSVVSGGRYLLWDPPTQKIRELNRQPPTRYVSTVARYEGSTNGFARLAVDPSRGSLLSALIDTPGFWERIQQGRVVGYVIITLGAFALLLGLGRLLVVFLTSRRVAAQGKRELADPGNPLGRVLHVYEDNQNADPETLELKLDEAVLRESTRLERFLWLIKVVSVVAPLLGLLGTVTGMIQTFQAITLFGAGDPKMMAGGISEALVTTMLGLTVAIPLVLLHAFLSSITKRVVDVLDQQSSGLIAMRAEETHVGA